LGPVADLPGPDPSKSGPALLAPEAERLKGQAWGLKTIESFHTYGTPPVEVLIKA
jgi:hypothetical protein